MEVLEEGVQDFKMKINKHIVGFANGFILMLTLELLLNNKISGLYIWIIFIFLLLVVIFLEEKFIFKKRDYIEMKGGKKR